MRSDIRNSNDATGQDTCNDLNMECNKEKREGVCLCSASTGCEDPPGDAAFWLKV